MTTIISIVAAIAASMMAGAVFDREFRRLRRRNRIIIGRRPMNSRSGDELVATVHACACHRCKNVVWVQGAEIEPPRFCAHCGYDYRGATEWVDDDEIREYYV